MKNIHALAVPALLVIAGCATAPVTPPSPHPDAASYRWEPLFAEDLSDAEFAKGAWLREGDVIRSAKDRPIWTKRDHENYVLDFEYLLEKGANSGAFIHITNLKKFPRYKIEVQMMDDAARSPKKLTYDASGSLYGRAAANAVAAKPAGEWNRMSVFCLGRNVRVVLNGKTVVDADLDDWKNPLVNPDGTPVPRWHRSFPALSTLPAKGRVGFQGLHGKGGIKIRAPRIAPLSVSP